MDGDNLNQEIEEIVAPEQTEPEEPSLSSYVDVNVESPTMMIASDFSTESEINGTYQRNEDGGFVKSDQSRFLKFSDGLWQFQDSEGTSLAEADGSDSSPPADAWRNDEGPVEGSICCEFGGMTMPEASPQTALMEEHWDGKEQSHDVVPDTLNVFGCSGHCERLNGSYTLSPEMKNGKVCYVNTDENMYLQWSNNSWIFSSVLQSDIDSEASYEDVQAKPMAIAAEDVACPSFVKEDWRILESFFGQYVPYPGLVIECAEFQDVEEVKEEEVQPAMVEDDKPQDPVEAFKNAPEPLVVEGFRGNNSILNGTYWKGEEMHAGRVYYEHNQNEVYIRFQRMQGCWMFSDVLSNKMAPLAQADDNALSVIDIKEQWQAPDAFFSKFVPRPDAKIGLGHMKKKSKKSNRKNRGVDRPIVRDTAHGDLSGAFDLSALGDCSDVIRSSCVEIVTGGIGEELAGVYIRGDENHNNKPFYQKQMGFISEDDEFTYICWHESSQWVITNDMDDLDAALAKTIDDTDAPWQVGSPWMVRASGKFKAEDAFTAKRVKEDGFGDNQDQDQSTVGDCSITDDDDRLDPHEQTVMLSQAPNQIVITGRSGQNDVINGTFNKGPRLHEEKVFYTHIDSSCVLRWHPAGLWIFSKTLSTDMQGYAACSFETFFPHDIKGPWKVFGTKIAEDDHIKITDAKIVRRQISKMAAKDNEADLYMQHDLMQAYQNFSPADDFPNMSGHRTGLSQVLTKKMYAELRNKQTPSGCTLDQCIQTGLDNPKSTGSGVLVGDVKCYDAFTPLIDGLLQHHHEDYPTDFEQETCWETCDVKTPEFDGDFVQSCRIRVDRNLDKQDMPVGMSRAQRRAVEKDVVHACAMIGGGFYQELDELDEKTLDEKRFAFQMNKPAFACRRDYPDGRGVYVGKGDRFSVWVNEEQHFSVVTNESSGDLKSAFDRAFAIVDTMEDSLHKMNQKFCYDTHYGFLNSDPRRCGTGLEISAILQLPLLTQHGAFRKILQTLRLTGTPVGEDTVSITNKDFVGVSESWLLKSMINAIETLIGIEQRLANCDPDDDLFPATVMVPWSESSNKQFLRQRLDSYVSFQAQIKAAGPPPESVIVFGRHGQNNILNGLYMLARDKFNQRQYWEKLGYDQVPVYLRWHNAGVWIFDNELVDEYKGMAFNKAEAVYPHKCAHNEWRVFDGDNFVLDDHFNITDHERGIRLHREEAEYVSWKSMPINDASHPPPKMHMPLVRQLSLTDAYRIVKAETFHSTSPEEIQVSGDHPRAVFINGKYRKCFKTTHNGKPIWRKCDGSYGCLMRWHTKGLWIISDFLSDRLSGFALVHDPLSRDPSQAKRCWKISAGASGYIKHPKVSVTAVEEEDSANFSGSDEEEANKEQEAIKEQAFE